MAVDCRTRYRQLRLRPQTLRGAGAKNSLCTIRRPFCLYFHINGGYGSCIKSTRSVQKSVRINCQNPFQGASRSSTIDEVLGEIVRG